MVVSFKTRKEIAEENEVLFAAAYKALQEGKFDSWFCKYSHEELDRLEYILGTKGIGVGRLDYEENLTPHKRIQRIFKFAVSYDTIQKMLELTKTDIEEIPLYMGGTLAEQAVAE